jgi:hypothetical protein
MVGHIAELGVVIGHEFREGNAAPAAGNLEFLQACERNMPKGKRIVVRSRGQRGLSGGDLQLVRSDRQGFRDWRGSGRAGEGGDRRHSRKRLENVPRRGNRRDDPLHEQDRQGLQIDRAAPTSGAGFIRRQWAISLSCHRQQSSR